MTSVRIGDRFIYTTPSGREAHYRVTATDVTPKYQHEPGPCVRLVADEHGFRDVTCWPNDLRHSWWRKDQQA